MSVIKIKMLALILIFLLVGILFLLNILSFICPSELIAKSTGAPIVIIRDNDFLCTGISQIVSDSENIYVLFGRYSVVQVYTHDGTYLYSISVYNHMNGRTEIAVHNNCLYLCDKANNIYIFSEKELKQYIAHGESHSICGQVSFGVNDPDYTMRSGSVWYAPKRELLHCVIQRPLWLSVYQNDLITLIIFVLVALAGAMLFIPHKTKGTKGRLM